MSCLLSPLVIMWQDSGLQRPLCLPVPSFSPAFRPCRKQWSSSFPLDKQAGGADEHSQSHSHGPAASLLLRKKKKKKHLQVFILLTTLFINSLVWTDACWVTVCCLSVVVITEWMMWRKEPDTCHRWRLRDWSGSVSTHLSNEQSSFLKSVSLDVAVVKSKHIFHNFETDWDFRMCRLMETTHCWASVWLTSVSAWMWSSWAPAEASVCCCTAVRSGTASLPAPPVGWCHETATLGEFKVWHLTLNIRFFQTFLV